MERRAGRLRRRIADGQEFPRRAKDDNSWHATGDLPVEKTLERRFIDTAAIWRKGRDGDGVTAAELLGHEGFPNWEVELRTLMLR